MMKFRILFVLIVGVIIASICNAASLNSNEREARAFLQRASAKLFNSNDKVYQAVLIIIDNDPDEVMNSVSPSELISAAIKQNVEIFNESKQFDVSKFNDPELKYIFKIIQNSPFKLIPHEEKFKEISLTNAAFGILLGVKKVPEYRNNKIDLAYSPDIEDIFAKSNDPDELKYYWTTWREKIGVAASASFLKTVKTLTEFAKAGEITPLNMWLGEYDISKMENVMKQIEPFYLQLHGFIRKQLHKKYGDSVIHPNGPIPHHLFEQVLAQVWTSGSVIDDIYPHKDLSAYDAILKQNNYDTLKMYKSADQFYQSLGLNPMPDEYWVDNFKMDKTRVECVSTIFGFSTNVTMRYCQKMDFGEFLKAHGYMGQVYYALGKLDLPAYYRDGYDLQFPVGEAVALSASTPKHLNSIGLVSELKFTEDLKMNGLLRKGIQTLLNVRVYFVYTKVMSDLFAGSVDITDLNKHYWKMMDKYVGVAPPVERGSDAYDFPLKFYDYLLDNRHPQDFMTEVLGYQFYEKLCEISGQYSRSIKSEPLNNCDFYGSKKAGDALKKLMGLGSSKPLREVLATVFPEDPAANAESLIEYYAPMESWLIKKNGEHNVIVGWTHSDKKVSSVTVPEKEDEDEEYK